MTIGEVAKRTGLRASAIRFYERAGILPKALRTSGRRQYDAAILDRMAVIRRAKACGFTLAEIRVLFNGQGLYSHKWRGLAEKKIAELDAAIQSFVEIKNLLRRSCQCATATECGRRIREASKSK